MPIYRLLLIAVLVLAASYAVSFASDCPRGIPEETTKATSSRPYARIPKELRVFPEINDVYFENYIDQVEYNGAGRQLPDPDPSTLSDIKIGFIAPLENNLDEPAGKSMLAGAELAIEEVNSRGGMCGRPFRLMVHNDSATWGASSNEVVKMVYNEGVWAIFGSISSDTTHIALRVALRAEVPLVNTASTDPTIPETNIPWYFTNIQDDRVQGYTLARYIYSDLRLSRIALLRVDNRYGKFGVAKFRSAARRLGKPVVVEQRFSPTTTDFSRQLEIIRQANVDGVVLWTDQIPAANILRQMRALGLGVPVFGSHRTIGNAFLERSGPAAEGFTAVFPYDDVRASRQLKEFGERFLHKYGSVPDQFAALAFDGMSVLLQSISKAGLNRARIRDVMSSLSRYEGITGVQLFDPNNKNITPMYLATVEDGRIKYRCYGMDRPYADIRKEQTPSTLPTSYISPKELRLVVVGKKVDARIDSADLRNYIAFLEQSGLRVSLLPVDSSLPWGKTATEIGRHIFGQGITGIIALDRESSHFAEQLAVKLFLPVIAVSDDKTLTSTNIPWIYRLPSDTPLRQAVMCFSEAAQLAGTSPSSVQRVLSAGERVGGLRFDSQGELVH